MYYVYLLKSITENFIYIGSTGNIEKRLFEHSNGKNRSTKFYSPFKLVYYEAYTSKDDALARERRLKHHGSVVGHLKKRLAKSFEDQ